MSACVMVCHVFVVLPYIALVTGDVATFLPSHLVSRLSPKPITSALPCLQTHCTKGNGRKVSRTFISVLKYSRTRDQHGLPAPNVTTDRWY